MTKEFLSIAAISIFSACGGELGSTADLEQTRKTSFHGEPLSAGTTLLCKASHVATGGFYRDLNTGEVSQSGRLGSEPETTWRITFSGQSAHVIRFSGASQEIEEPRRFVVGEAAVGLILVSARASDESPEAITIDPENGSFVYSSQMVNLLWNRANVFYGTCVQSE
jgi:hypothetical protein